MVEHSIEYHPAARLEAIDAFDWYRGRSRGVAEHLQHELARAQLDIQESPDRWAEYMYGTRRYLVKRFPIVVVYRMLAGRIQIVAIAHGRKKPGYWADRLKWPQ